MGNFISSPTSEAFFRVAVTYKVRGRDIQYVGPVYDLSHLLCAIKAARAASLSSDRQCVVVAFKTEADAESGVPN